MKRTWLEEEEMVVEEMEEEEEEKERSSFYTPLSLTSRTNDKSKAIHCEKNSAVSLCLICSA